MQSYFLKLELIGKQSSRSIILDKWLAIRRKIEYTVRTVKYIYSQFDWAYDNSVIGITHKGDDRMVEKE